MGVKEMMCTMNLGTLALLFPAIYRTLHGKKQRYFPTEIDPSLKHKSKGTVSMAVAEDASIETGGVSGSQFFITLGGELGYLDGTYAIFGKVAGGLEALDKMNEVCGIQ